MASLVPEKPVPTSFGAVKSGAKSSIRTGFGLVWLVLGAGLFLFALPWLAQIPVVGQMIARGASILPGQRGAVGIDENGTVMG